MKKLVLALALVMVVLFTGCGQDKEEELQKEIEMLQETVQEMEEEIENSYQEATPVVPRSGSVTPIDGEYQAELQANSQKNNW